MNSSRSSVIVSSPGPSQVLKSPPITVGSGDGARWVGDSASASSRASVWRVREAPALAQNRRAPERFSRWTLTTRSCQGAPSGSVPSTTPESATRR